MSNLVKPPGEKPVLFYTDRSGAETDDFCGAKFWWQRKANGGGIVPVDEVLPLMIGRITHEDLHCIAQMEDITPPAIQQHVEEILGALSEDDKLDQNKMELLYRRLGWFVGFAFFIEPGIRAKYDDVAVEKEMILNRLPLWIGVTPDRVLRNKETGKLEYREYKTTVSANTKWMASWQWAIQLHIGMAAIQEELGEDVGFSQIMGLMKGYYSQSGENRLMHPYVWGYQNLNTGEWTHEYAKARTGAWSAMPVWEYEGGIVEWVSRLGAEVALSQFPHSQPVFLNRMLLNDWVMRRTYRERHMRSVDTLCQESPLVRSLHYPHIQAHCKPAFGDACPYIMACWNASVGEDPIGSGLFTKRVPHHKSEILINQENILT